MFVFTRNIFNLTKGIYQDFVILHWELYFVDSNLRKSYDLVLCKQLQPRPWDIDVIDKINGKLYIEKIRLLLIDW